MCTFAGVNFKKMKKQDDLLLMKARSYRSVLATGFQLYTSYFRRFFKASWQMAILYALSCGALGTLTAIKLPEISTGITQQLLTYQAVSIESLQSYFIIGLEILLLMLLALATLALASAPILSKLKEHKETGTITTPPHWFSASPHLMGRSLKGVFLTALILLIPFCLFVAAMFVLDTVSQQFILRHLTTTIVAFFVYGFIVILFSLPLFHVLMKYLMEAPCGYWRTLGRSYASGMRHWGLLFLVFFVSMLLIQLVGFVVLLPSHILSFANQQAHQGLLFGDPLGMPSYITTLTFITVTLCCFIQFYVSQVLLVHNYYIYGSIEAREQERNNIENP